MLTELPLLDETECQDLRDTLHGLRPHWIKRAPDVPFFTLGAASYLDRAATFERSRYTTLAERYNPLLEQHFGDLLDRVAKALAEHLGAPVDWRGPHARPGFHLFLAHPAFERPVASRHYDLQYELLDWERPEELDFDHPLTFTLPIRMPREGGGLRYWEVERAELEAIPVPDRSALLFRHARHHAYTPGHMLVHAGTLFHQIAPARALEPDDERITLQGHALCRRGTWECYW